MPAAIILLEASGLSQQGCSGAAEEEERLLTQACATLSATPDSKLLTWLLPSLSGLPKIGAGQRANQLPVLKMMLSSEAGCISSERHANHA